MDSLKQLNSSFQQSKEQFVKKQNYEDLENLTRGINQLLAGPLYPQFSKVLKDNVDPILNLMIVKTSEESDKLKSFNILIDQGVSFSISSSGAKKVTKLNSYGDTVKKYFNIPEDVSELVMLYLTHDRYYNLINFYDHLISPLYERP